jgi:hypothetical protein
MSRRAAKSRRPSFVFAPGDSTPAQRALIALVNRHEQARAHSDRDERRRLRPAIDYALEDFVRSGGDGHPYPQWIVPVMQATVCAVYDDLEGALGYEKAGEAVARDILAQAGDKDGARARSACRLLARSLSNLSDHYRRLDRPSEAVTAGREAVLLWPENDAIVVNLAMALYRDGQKGLCGRLIRKLLASADLSDPTSVLRACALFEEELQDMKDDVPAIRQLLDAVQPNRHLAFPSRP